MNVKQLIEKLSKYDPNAEVYTDYVEEGGLVHSANGKITTGNENCGELCEVKQGTLVVLISSHH